jgi:hypothetical protein
MLVVGKGMQLLMLPVMLPVVVLMQVGCTK